MASMLPEEWEKKLIDMNVSLLTEDDLEWADYVFISAMVVQKKSAREVMKRCKKLGIKIAAGGPLFTTGYEEFEDVDHLVLNEAESTLPSFLDIAKTPPLPQLSDNICYLWLSFSKNCGNLII